MGVVAERSVELACHVDRRLEVEAQDEERALVLRVILLLAHAFTSST